MGYDVFISYSSKDKHTADAVCTVLESEGVRCWIAPRDIRPGMDWGESIIDAIHDCKAFVLVFSKNANASVQIKREVERAASRGIPIIPFRIEDVMPERALEYFLATQHWLDAFSPPMDRHIRYLAQSLKSHIENTPPPVELPLPRRAPGFKLAGWQLIAGAIAVAVAAGAGSYFAISVMGVGQTQTQTISAVQPPPIGLPPTPEIPGAVPAVPSPQGVGAPPLVPSQTGFLPPPVPDKLIGSPPSPPIQLPRQGEANAPIIAPPPLPNGAPPPPSLPAQLPQPADTRIATLTSPAPPAQNRQAAPLTGAAQSWVGKWRSARIQLNIDVLAPTFASATMGDIMLAAFMGAGVVAELEVDRQGRAVYVLRGEDRGTVERTGSNAFKLTSAKGRSESIQVTEIPAQLVPGMAYLGAKPGDIGWEFIGPPQRIPTDWFSAPSATSDASTAFHSQILLASRWPIFASELTLMPTRYELHVTEELRGRFTAQGNNWNFEPDSSMAESGEFRVNDSDTITSNSGIGSVVWKRVN